MPRGAGSEKLGCYPHSDDAWQMKGADAFAPLFACSSSSSSASAPVASGAQSVQLSSGKHMPMIGLGTFELHSPEVVKNALALGYRHFDCASYYGTEHLVGAGMSPFIAAGRRSELWITSKLWNTNHHHQDARSSVLQSLEDLGVQYLDLLLVHWPQAWLKGSTVHGEVFEDGSITLTQAWQGLEALVDEGLVRHLGLSNFNIKQIDGILAVARHKPVVNQIELHPLLPQHDLVTEAQARGIISVAHTPLCQQCKDLREHPNVQAVSGETGKSINQVVLRWNIQRGVAVIPKANSSEHQAQNFSGMFEWSLTSAQQELLGSMGTGYRVWALPWMMKCYAQELDCSATSPPGPRMM